MGRRLALMLGLVALVAGCGGAHRDAAPGLLLAQDDSLQSPDGSYAMRLVRLDPVTFRPMPGPGLRLDDSVASSVVAPDGRTVALGELNDGGAVFVDLRRLAATGRVSVRRPSDEADFELTLFNWPRPDRLIAGVSESPGKYARPTTLVVIDPRRPSVVRTAPLHGTVLASARASLGRTVLLVGTVGPPAPARLVVVSADGAVRQTRLARIAAGGLLAERRPALVTAGGHALVVGGGEPVAEIDLRALTVSYHAVAGLLDAYLRPAPILEAGSAGALRASRRCASWLDPGRLLVTGNDEYPTAGLARFVTRAATEVDTRSWRIVRVFRGVARLEPVGGVLVGSGSVSVGQLSVGPPVVGLRRDGTVLYRRRDPDRQWQVVANRLLFYNGDGRLLAELDPRTGRVLRSFGLRGAWPPLDLIATRPGARTPECG